MMRIQTFERTQIAFAIGALVLALESDGAFAAAFALQEQSGSGLGNAFAGGAAIAEDASTIWSNPAGMSRLGSTQFVTAVHLITPRIKFRNDGSLPAAAQPLGNDGGDAGGLNVVPNLYVSVPIRDRFAFGLGVGAPFGLVTEYGDGWIGRFQALKSEIKTINVNPSVSWKVSDLVAIGAGINYQRIDAELTNSVNYSAGLAQAAQQAAARGLIPAALVPTIAGATAGLEAHAKVDGEDDAFGWNVGILVKLSSNTRLGASYRSSIEYDVSGNVSFGRPALPTLPAALAPVVAQLATGVNAQLADGGVKAEIELPDIANVSIFHKLNDRWDIMGDVQWTRWSTIKELRFVRTNGTLLSVTPQNFDDAFRVAAGVNYHHDDRWMFRGGIAYDETPVNSTDRTPRLPDESRVWFSVGTQYTFSPHLKVDAGFTYIKADKADIQQNAGSTAANGLIKGHYDADVTILSGQITYSF